MNLTRIFTFLIGCIGIRLSLVYIAKNHTNYLPIMGKLALLPAIGFTIIYLNDLRKKGAETFGKPIWWNDLRPLHASLYFMFAVYAIKKYDNAWIPLFIDTIIGLLAFLQYHFNVF